MTQADTPDYQRGVISAQKLLGTIAPGDIQVTVGVPPNAETVVLIVTDQTPAEGGYCTGKTSGAIYPLGTVVTTRGSLQSVVSWFDVSAVVDDQVTVFLDTAATGTAYVYADSAVHTFNDPIVTSVLQGVMNTAHSALYATPIVPSTATGDHPPDEIQVAGKALTASGALIPAPGAGKRIRVFALAMSTITTGFEGVLWGGDFANYLLGVAGPGNQSITLPGQGVPLAENVDLYFSITGAAGTVYAVAYYTVETV